MSVEIQQNEVELDKIILSLNAMHLAQLTAFAFRLPPLYFCKEYLALTDQKIIELCKQRLLKIISDNTVTHQQIRELLNKEYFEDDEARLRLMPI